MSERDVFIAALHLAIPAERAAYLDEACGQDRAMRDRIEELIREQDQLGSFLERPAEPPGKVGAFSPPAAPVATVDEPQHERPGTVLGPYKLIEEIGAGGMGSVWMAQQQEPVKRLVAVKVIKAGMDTKQVIARFEAERQALALMDHPNIARVLDAGTTAASRPYFVMELVKGQPITRYCDEHRLTPRQRLELMVPVCQAVQHAHQKGIIHRDLKPSNVLVASYDGRPVPKVIDFGVAKAAGQPLTEKTLVTGFGAIVGTLEYMSPEQAEVNQLDIDTRSDIYSLGVLLYELLAGSPPFSRQELEKGGLLEMLRVIREQEPTRPSTKLSTAEGLPTLAANRGTEPAQLARLVRGELDWIVMKALEKDRSRRYESSSAFAADVGRYLADEPVLACPPSAGYRLRKFTRRNRVGLAAAALVLLCLLLLGGGAGWAWRDRAARQEEEARQQEQRQAKVAGQVESILAEVDRLEGERKWREALAAARRAEAAVAGGEADAATAGRVRQRLKDIEFIDRLEQFRAQLQGSGDRDRDYARAFREYGVDIDELGSRASIDRLKARAALALPLAAALGDWIYHRRNAIIIRVGESSGWVRQEDDVVAPRRAITEKEAAGWKRLLAVARGIDPDPLRDRLRSTQGQRGPKVQGELRRLADSIDVGAQHPTTIHLLARAIIGRQDRGSAIRILREAQYAHPGDFDITFALGMELAIQKDHEGALRYYTAAVSIRPHSGGAHMNLARALRNLGRLDEAIASYRKALELQPTWSTPYEDLAGVLRDRGRLDEAVAIYRKYVEAYPKDYRPYNLLGFALREQKKLKEANAAFAKAIEVARRGNELSPSPADPSLVLGNVLRDQGKLGEAIDAYREAVKRGPKNAGAYLQLGVALFKQKKWPEAIDAYRKATDLNPRSALAYSNLGGALANQGKLDDAIEACRKAIEIDQNNADTYLNLGVALFKQKKWPDAAAAFRKVTEFDPKNAGAYADLGAALATQGKLDDAIAALRKAIELDPKLADAYSNLGGALTNQGKRDDAIAALRKALELNPKHANAQKGLCFALGSKAWAAVADPALANRRALGLANEAVGLAPNWEMSWQFLGWVHYRAGDWRSSIEALERSCQLQPGGKGDAGQWVVLALAHARLAAQQGLPLKARELHRARARRWFDQSEKHLASWRVRPGHEVRQAIWDFRAEARELMGGKEKRD